MPEGATRHAGAGEIGVMMAFFGAGGLLGAIAATMALVPGGLLLGVILGVVAFFAPVANTTIITDQMLSGG